LIRLETPTPADGPAPSFSLHAPSGLSSDDDEGQEAQSGAPAGGREERRLSGVRRPTPAELALADVTAQLASRLRLESQRKVMDLERALLEIEAEEAAAAAAAAAAKDKAAAEAAAAEAEAAAARRQQRTQLLSELRNDARAKATEGERQVAQLEAAMKKQQEAAAAAAKAQAEKKAAAEAAAKAEAQRQKQQAEAKAAAEQAATQAAKEAAEKQRAAAVAPPADGLRIAPSAAEWERQCAQKLAEAQVGVCPQAVGSDARLVISAQSISLALRCAPAVSTRTPPPHVSASLPFCKPATSCCITLRLPHTMLAPCRRDRLPHPFSSHVPPPFTRPAIPAPHLLPPQAAAQPFVEDRAMRDRKRATDKFVTLNVQQISATLEQAGRCDTALHLYCPCV
jgi:chemotaxis protein histidine kinase CheA